MSIDASFVDPSSPMIQTILSWVLRSTSSFQTTWITLKRVLLTPAMPQGDRSSFLDRVRSGGIVLECKWRQRLGHIDPGSEVSRARGPLHTKEVALT